MDYENVANREGAVVRALAFPCPASIPPEM